jgi:hypothetical protein
LVKIFKDEVADIDNDHDGDDLHCNLYYYSTQGIRSAR